MLLLQEENPCTDLGHQSEQCPGKDYDGQFPSNNSGKGDINLPLVLSVCQSIYAFSIYIFYLVITAVIHIVLAFTETGNSHFSQSLNIK